MLGSGISNSPRMLISACASFLAPTLMGLVGPLAVMLGEGVVAPPLRCRVLAWHAAVGTWVPIWWLAGAAVLEVVGGLAFEGVPVLREVGTL